MGINTLWCAFKKFVADDSMSLALLALFVLCLVGQGLTGWHAYNDSLANAHFATLGLGAYLGTGTFLDGIFSNWQAAILQLAILIAFGSVLRQKGAAHSRKEGQSSHRTIAWKFGARPTILGWLKANSLSLVFFAMFATTFLSHAILGTWRYNEEQVLRHLPPMSVAAYAGSSDFWFSVFQCWEAEFAVIGIYILLSIFLRQENSPESKPVEAANGQTGGPNE